MNGRLRKNIRIAAWVKIVQKDQQQNGELTEGTVRRVLTKSSEHPYGIKGLLGFYKNHSV